MKKHGISAHSSFTWGIQDEFLIVTDSGMYGGVPGAKSVTNDLENVAETLHGHLGTRFWELMFIYRDSEGNWEGVEFSRSFNPSWMGINSPDIDEVKAVMLGRRI